MFNNKPRAVQFLRFCTVGMGNTAVDFTAFFLMTLGGVPHLLAQTLAYSAGVLNSFFLNRRWTFGITSKAHFSEVARFIVVNGLSLLVSAGLLFILHDVNHLNLWISKLTATGTAIIVNFMGSRIWVFAEHQKTRGEIA